jgi:hypothetical protein
MTTLIVGDRAQIERSIKALPFVERIQRVDAEGNPVSNPATLKSAGAAARRLELAGNLAIAVSASFAVALSWPLSGRNQ